MYVAGGLLKDCLWVSNPPITTYSFYKRLGERGYKPRGRLTRRSIKTSGILVCKSCGKEKELKSFTMHAQTKTGYDTSACKICKKSKVDWTKVPLEKKILNRAKERAKKKGVPFDITLEDILIPSHCPVFGKPLIYGDHKWAPSIDRFIPELGYVKGNIFIISNFANMLKGDATLEELEKLVDWIRGVSSPINL